MNEQDREQLVKELKELKKLGVRVSENTIQHAKEDDLSEFEGISVSELTSLFIELYN
jgi:hypothetical protein